MDSPRYLPRKGTETFLLIRHNTMSLYIIRHDIYPARGRKRSYTKEDRVIEIRYSPRYLPRKGTETLIYTLTINIGSLLFATIFTPQGDGNLK